MPRGQTRSPKERAVPVPLTERNSSPTLDGPATWPGGPAVVHMNVTLLEGVSAALVDEVLVGTTLGNAVVRRLTPTALLIDQEQIGEVITLLTKRGYEPKVIDAVPQDNLR